jgi:uncharacterized membrane protein HdeD (DUF308 family)
MPAVLPYAVGAMLIVFGSLRAIYMGWQRRSQQLEPDPEDEGRRFQKKGPRYHLMIGILWVVMGLFLVISTYYQTHRY